MIAGLQLPSCSARSYLALGASAIALSVTTPAFAQQATVQILRHATQTSDGDSVTSVSNDMLVARKRVGDRSIMVFDALNGAVTVERAGTIDIRSLISARGPEAAVAYDYRTQTLSADAGPAAAFNTHLRPVALQTPALGADAAWRVSTTLAAIGVAAVDASVAFELSRTHVQVDGKPVLLFEYEIPAFTYVTPAGETVVHWARGLALTDDKLAGLHTLATQHRASVIGADGALRPVSVKTSIHAIDKTGDWTIDLANAPKVHAAVERLAAVAGDDVHQVADDDTNPAPDSFPATVARRLDMAALAAAEGGANPMPTTLEQASSFAQTDPSEQRQTPEGETRTTTVVKTVRVRRNNGEAPPPPSASSETPGSLIQPTPATSTSNRSRMLEGLQNYIQSDYEMMRLDPDGGFTYRTAEERQLNQPINEMLENAGRADPGRSGESPAFTYRTAEERQLSQPINEMLENAGRTDPGRSGGGAQDFLWSLARQRSLLRQFESNGQGNSPEADNVREQMLRGLDQYIYDDYQTLHLRNDGSPGRFNANLDSLVGPMPGGFGDEMPGWIEPGSLDAATFTELLASLQLSLDEIRSLVDDAPDSGSGLSSLDKFVHNNAFDYLSMVGIVETDLSRWGEWLATQNVRELERLASQIGYPNLASALADAENLIRQSQDPGYRQWALQAPSCNGPAGCGPSYLERWWMKQSVVALGDILADSRDIFSTGGFSDIGISGLDLSYLLRDHSLEDGDIVQIRISQFGKAIYEGTVNLTNAGEAFGMLLGKGVASLEIYAVNEGYSSPNTAQITVDKVVRGEATQTYSLNTGQTATLRIEAGARPAPATGTAGGPQ